VIRRRWSAGIRLTRRVALVAESLPGIGADFHWTSSVPDQWEREAAGGKVHLLAAIEEGE
jgi:hypothetical protein